MEILKQIDNGLRREQIYLIFNQVFRLKPQADKIGVKSFLTHLGQNHYEIEKIILELRETLQNCNIDLIKILILYEIPLLGRVNSHEFIKIINKIDKTLRYEQIMLVFKHMERIAPNKDLVHNKLDVSFLLEFFLGAAATQRDTAQDADTNQLLTDIKCYISTNGVSLREVILSLGMKIEDEVEYLSVERLLQVLYPGLSKDKTYNIFRKFDVHRNGKVPVELLFSEFNQNKQECEKIYNSLKERVLERDLSIRELMIDLEMATVFDSKEVC